MVRGNIMQKLEQIVEFIRFYERTNSIWTRDHCNFVQRHTSIPFIGTLNWMQCVSLLNSLRLFKGGTWFIAKAFTRDVISCCTLDSTIQLNNLRSYRKRMEFLLWILIDWRCHLIFYYLRFRDRARIFLWFLRSKKKKKQQSFGPQRAERNFTKLLQTNTNCAR